MSRPGCARLQYFFDISKIDLIQTLRGQLQKHFFFCNGLVRTVSFSVNFEQRWVFYWEEHEIARQSSIPQHSRVFGTDRQMDRAIARKHSAHCARWRKRRVIISAQLSPTINTPRRTNRLASGIYSRGDIARRQARHWPAATSEQYDICTNHPNRLNKYYVHT